LIWSRLVRLSHWLMAAGVLFNLFNETGPLHRYVGYAVAAVTVLRLSWGLTRPRADHAHVGWPGLAALREHLQGLREGHVHRSLGHNPAGMCMALLLWALVLALGVSGWMTQLDAYWGEDWLIDTHEWLAYALQACLLMHWAGVIVMSRLQGENLLKAMITGRKKP
jgi:cytochrome b